MKKIYKIIIFKEVNKVSSIKSSKVEQPAIYFLIFIVSLGQYEMAQESRFMTDFDKTSVCKRMNKTLILSTSLSPTKPLFLVAAAFNLNNNRSPTWQKNMMAYLSFRSNLKIFLRSQNLQWGAVLYETTCFRNEIEMVITDILLSRLSDHTDYTLVAMFTEELEKLPLVASILLPYLIPVYGISIATDKYSTVYHNYHHSLRVSNVIQNKQHVIRKKMQQFLEQSAYGEVTIFRGADLTLEENSCLLYTSPSPRDKRQSRMPSSA